MLIVSCRLHYFFAHSYRPQKRIDMNYSDLNSCTLKYAFIRFGNVFYRAQSPSLFHIHLQPFTGSALSHLHCLIWRRHFCPELGFLQESRFILSEILGYHNTEYVYAPHNDVSVNDGQHIRRWSHKIILYHIISYIIFIYENHITNHIISYHIYNHCILVQLHYACSVTKSNGACCK